MPAPDQLPHLAHVVMPFSRSGSAITTVVRHLAREHASVGGRTSVVVSHNRDTVVHDATTVAVDHTEIAPREYFSRPQMLFDHAAGAFGLPRPFTGRLQDPAFERLRPSEPDVVVVHEGHYASSTLPRWRTAFPDARLVLYVHTPIARSYTRSELSRLWRSCDDLVFVSDSLRSRAMTRAKYAGPVHTVLNGTVIESHRQERDRSRVLFVGAMIPEKGAHLAIAAVGLMRRRGIDVTLEIAGSNVYGTSDTLTRYDRRVRELAAALGDAVQILGYVPHDELPVLYQRAGVVCIPSTWADPCPLVALEALGNGSPVVATPRGGIPEIGLDAFVYADTTAGSMAEALSRVLRDATTSASLERRARERAGDLTWASQYRRLLASLGYGSGTSGSAQPAGTGS